MGKCVNHYYEERPAMTEQESDAAFEQWWEQHGQFCRAGGGDYEKTFAYRAWQARGAQPVARTPLSDDLPKGFLSDVLTAAGLVSHGKQCKALGSRIGEAVESIWKISIQQREALPTHGITQEKHG